MLCSNVIGHKYIGGSQSPHLQMQQPTRDLNLHCRETLKSLRFFHFFLLSAYLGFFFCLSALVDKYEIGSNINRIYFDFVKKVIPIFLDISPTPLFTVAIAWAAS
jgi:hypothetical protein